MFDTLDENLRALLSILSKARLQYIILVLKRLHKRKSLGSTHGHLSMDLRASTFLLVVVLETPALTLNSNASIICANSQIGSPYQKLFPGCQFFFQFTLHNIQRKIATPFTLMDVLPSISSLNTLQRQQYMGSSLPHKIAQMCKNYSSDPERARFQIQAVATSLAVSEELVACPILSIM